NTFFTQDIVLYSGIGRVDFRTNVDWWEDKTMLKVAFPLAVRDTVATYEIPYGHITRSVLDKTKWEKARVEVPAHRWADLSQSDYGVSLLNKSKYGYDIKGNTMRVSLLRSPKWPDPTADRGEHLIEYSLYSHKGRWQEGKTVQRGYEYNTPLIPVVLAPGRGKLPAMGSFFQCEPQNVLLTLVKKAEDSGAWVVQFYESSGKDATATITLPRTAKKVILSNFLEEEISPVVFQGQIVSVKVGKNQVVTLKVLF
ncbi:MAG: glycoside hydrolase family 38 C-terminal domain-containing protein, partial [Bacteroidota bacterium]